MMRRALSCARKGWGRTHPNPMVGAVLCEGGRVVAEGFHTQAGAPHAEIEALRALGRAPNPDAVLYVTLEPCSTFGRTPPCTDAILKAGIRRVVVGARDPNPAHAGRGFDVLRRGGVEVVEGVLERDCADLNLVFNHWIQTKTPFIAGKAAVTLDGRVASRTGVSRWITGREARADVHRWRGYFPAIAVGSGTALADDPALTVRMEGAPERCPARRFVFDRRLRTAERPDLKIFSDAYRDATVVVSDDAASPRALERFAAFGVCVWTLPQADFFDAFKARCVAEGVYGVYCEGGASLLSAFAASRALDYLFLYRAPLALADNAAPPFLFGRAPERLDEALRLEDVRRAVLGDDDVLRGRVVYPQ